MQRLSARWGRLEAKRLAISATATAAPSRVRNKTPHTGSFRQNRAGRLRRRCQPALAGAAARPKPRAKVSQRLRGKRGGRTHPGAPQTERPRRRQRTRRLSCGRPPGTAPPAQPAMAGKVASAAERQAMMVTYAEGKGHRRGGRIGGGDEHGGGRRGGIVMTRAQGGRRAAVSDPE